VRPGSGLPTGGAGWLPPLGPEKHSPPPEATARTTPCVQIRPAPTRNSTSFGNRSTPKACPRHAWTSPCWTAPGHRPHHGPARPTAARGLGRDRDAPRPSNPTTTTGSTTCGQASTNTIRSSTGGSARERPSPSSTGGARASFAPSGSIRKARANWSRRTRRRTRPARPLVASSHRERLGRAGKRSHPGQQAPGARRYDRPLRHR
jgi:hypothetical protein